MTTALSSVSLCVAALATLLGACEPEVVVYVPDAGWVPPPVAPSPAVRGTYSDDSCPEGLVRCGERCVDTRGDARDCGGCGATCTTGLACNSGVCRVTCAPGTTLCTSEGELRCADTSRDPRHCGACGTSCGSDERCEDGVCRSLPCRPDAAECVNMNERRACLPNGLGYGPTTSCGTSQSCAPETGLCTGWTCTPGAATCAPSGERRVCSADGLSEMDSACAARETCVFGVCTRWACTPGDYACSDVNTRVVCGADGLGSSPAPCPDTGDANGSACLGAGLCTPRICMPGTSEPTCASGSARSVCAPDGQRYAPVACAANESCSGGVCVPRICIPGSARCVAGSLTDREVCDADGLGYSPMPCADTETCRSSVCTARICTPGAPSCDGTTGMRTCTDGLNFSATMTCASGQSCEPARGRCVCVPGTSRCTAVSLTGREVCNGDAVSYSASPCAATQTCTGLGVCTDRLCTPGEGTSICSSAVDRQVCAADGLGFTSVTCAAGQSCLTGACAIRCGDGLVGTGETCDDGNTANGDGCSGSCLAELPLSRGRPASQSSTDRTFAAANGVDGRYRITDPGTVGTLNLVSTLSESQPWWQVDLGSARTISRVDVWRRDDGCCTSRITNFDVLTSMDGITWNSFAYEPGTAGFPSRYVSSATGRYVRIQLRGSDYLNLTEVEVLGF
jgi:cysteine-rich repeat protein